MCPSLLFFPSDAEPSIFIRPRTSPCIGHTEIHAVNHWRLPPMRTRSVNYFVGSLLSRQVFVAYGIAGSITTLGQQLLIWFGVFGGIPTRTERLPEFIELYIETLIPIWIPPVTGWNVFIFLLNAAITLWLLLYWTMKYDRSY